MSEGILPATVAAASTNSNPTNNNNNNLPRGLMSKSGLPFNPNQRLPSLRSSLSKPSLLFQSNVSFTHSPITSLSNTTNNKSQVTNKRNYETTTNGSDDCGGGVTTRRQQLGEGKGFANGIKQGKNSLDCWKGTSSSTSTSRGRGRRQTNNKKQKKLIQLEGAVFTGAARSPIKSVADTKKSRGKKALAPSPVQEESEEDSVEPAIIEGKLYQDDFIDRLSDQDDNCEHLPQGWETLSLSTPSSTSSVKESVTPSHSKSTDWLTPDPLRDKLILFQLPKMLENQTNLKLGKLRIYESGKIELVNNPSDLTFEVIKVESTESISKSSGSSTLQPSVSSSSTAQPQLPSTFSQSSDGLTTNTDPSDKKHELTKVNHIEPRLNREVVIYSGRNLISVGKLEPEVAIVVPKLFNSTS